MTTGVSLRAERLASQVQQQELAAELGVGHSALAQLERRSHVRTETASRYRQGLARCIRRRAVDQISSTITTLEIARDSLQDEVVVADV